MAPALKDHSLSASELPILLPSRNHGHQLVVFLSALRALVNGFLNDHLLMLSQLILGINILFSFDVDHFLIKLSLLNVLPELTLSLLSHELGQD